ncbi:MAG: SDR family NAD(P)-dependent oxidoreductase [Bacteroidota bacterium]
MDNNGRPGTATALITGATSGIGRSTAELFAQNGFSLVLCGRRQERLKTLQEKLMGTCPVHILNFDVRDKEAVAKAIASLPADFSQIDVLINNAGNAHGLNPIHEGSLEDWDAMMDSNVKGLLYVSKAVMPQMVERKKGHIINIGSIAGKEVYPKGSVYCASKHAVDAINQGMRMDLNAHGIKVSAVHPGAVETEFSDVRFKGDDKRAGQVYQGYQPLTAEDIADVLLFTVTRPYHVNLADILVLPTAQASTSVWNKE